MRFNMGKLIKGMVVALALAAISGCGLFWDDPYIQVTAAPLNWCEIHYYNAKKEPVRRDTVRISGTGLVEVRTGTSRRVSDNFSKETDNAQSGYRTQQYYVDPQHVREEFQNLVNAGLFDKDKVLTSTKYPSPGRFIAVRAAIDNKTFSESYNIFEEDPELAERLLNMVHEYRRVVLGRKKSGAGRKDADEDSDKDDKKDDENHKDGEVGKEKK